MVDVLYGGVDRRDPVDIEDLARRAEFEQRSPVGDNKCTGLYTWYHLGDRLRESRLGWLRAGVAVGLSEVDRNPDSKGNSHPGRCLLEMLRDRLNDVVRFAYDLNVPPTSNQAERDLRPAKTQQKISGRLTSEPSPAPATASAATSAPPPSTASTNSPLSTTRFSATPGRHQPERPPDHAGRSRRVIRRGRTSARGSTADRHAAA
jgi:Transposase IS66 family